MGQESAVQATIKGNVSEQVAVGNYIVQMVDVNGEFVNIVLPPDQPANWGQLA
jgi:hypothetical protein